MRTSCVPRAAGGRTMCLMMWRPEPYCLYDNTSKGGAGRPSRRLRPFREGLVAPHASIVNCALRASSMLPRGREHVRGLTPREAGQRSTPARHVPRRSLSDGSSEAGSSRSVASSSTTKPSGTGSLLLSASRYTTRWLHVGGLEHA